MFTNKNPFPDLLWSQIKTAVEQGLETPGPHYAAFDADGTLWPLDAGETFFRFQIERCGLPGLPADPWAHYHNLKSEDAPASCLWLAQINRGQTVDQVRRWAEECYSDPQAFPIHQSMYDLVDWLSRSGVQVFIVTASIKWAVEPVAKRLGLDHERVLGIEVGEEGGRLTDKAVLPLTHGEGKPAAFLNRTKGVRPLLAAGNTLSDAPLIETASHIRLAISSHPPGDSTHESEMRLRELAADKGWLSHKF